MKKSYAPLAAAIMTAFGLSSAQAQEERKVDFELSGFNAAVDCVKKVVRDNLGKGAEFLSATDEEIGARWSDDYTYREITVSLVKSFVTSAGISLSENPQPDGMGDRTYQYSGHASLRYTSAYGVMNVWQFGSSDALNPESFLRKVDHDLRQCNFLG